MYFDGVQESTEGFPSQKGQICTRILACGRAACDLILFIKPSEVGLIIVPVLQLRTLRGVYSFKVTQLVRARTNGSGHDPRAHALINLFGCEATRHGFLDKQ